TELSISTHQNPRLLMAQKRKTAGRPHFGAVLVLCLVVAFITMSTTALHGGPTPALAVTDTDGDGWSDSAEAAIGTDPLEACAHNSSDNAWPADINNDTFSDIFDITLLAGSFSQSVPPAPARYDIAPDPPDGFVDIF